MAACEDCGTERKHLHRHHIIPKSSGGSDEAWNRVSVCANCHVRRHGGPCGGRLRGKNSTTPEAIAKAASTRLKRMGPEKRAFTLERLALGRAESEARRLAGSHEPRSRKSSD